MNICIPHNGWGRKSQNVILWEHCHYLFFINTIILIETQLPAEKAAPFWNILFLALKNKQQTSEWKSHCFHFFIWTNTLVYYALRKAVKDGLLCLRCSQGFFWMCYKSLGDPEGLVQSTPPQFQGYQYFCTVTMWPIPFCCILTVI